jgi:hypothetical protein
MTSDVDTIGVYSIYPTRRHMPDSKLSPIGIARLRQFVEDKEYLEARDSFERVVDPDEFDLGPEYEEYFDEKNRIRHEIYWRFPIKEVVKIPGEEDFEIEGEPKQVHSKYTLTDWIEKNLVDTLERIEKEFSVEVNTDTENPLMEWKERDCPGSIRALLRVIRRRLEKEEDEECRKDMNAVIDRLDHKLIETLPDEVQIKLRSSRRGNPCYDRNKIFKQEKKIAAYAQKLIDAEPEKYRPRKNAVVSNLLNVEIVEKFGIKESTSYRRLKNALERKQFFYR